MSDLNNLLGQVDVWIHRNIQRQQIQRLHAILDQPAIVPNGNALWFERIASGPGNTQYTGASLDVLMHDATQHRANCLVTCGQTGPSSSQAIVVDSYPTPDPMSLLSMRKEEALTPENVRDAAPPWVSVFGFIPKRHEAVGIYGERLTPPAKDTLLTFLLTHKPHAPVPRDFYCDSRYEWSAS